MSNEMNMDDMDDAKVYLVSDLIARGVKKKEISDCVRAGFMELGQGKLADGQIVNLVRITKRGNAAQRVYPTEIRKLPPK